MTHDNPWDKDDYDGVHGASHSEPHGTPYSMELVVVWCASWLAPCGLLWGTPWGMVPHDDPWGGP